MFSKYLHLVPVKTKNGPSVASAFRFIFHNESRSTVWVRKNKGKEFRNEEFEDMLRDEGIQFQVCKNPDVKCAVVERAHPTIRDTQQMLYI